MMNFSLKSRKLFSAAVSVFLSGARPQTHTITLSEQNRLVFSISGVFRFEWVVVPLLAQMLASNAMTAEQSDSNTTMCTKMRPIIGSSCDRSLWGVHVNRAAKHRLSRRETKIIYRRVLLFTRAEALEPDHLGRGCRTQSSVSTQQKISGQFYFYWHSLDKTSAGRRFHQIWAFFQTSEDLIDQFCLYTKGFTVLHKLIF